MLVMRMMGNRFQHSARRVPPDRFDADVVRSFARTQISGKQAVGDNRRALRRHAFLVESESSQPWTVLLAGVGDNVHQIAAIAQGAQFVQSKKRRPREVRFHSQNAVKLDGMAHGFVDLQPSCEPSRMISNTPSGHALL